MRELKDKVVVYITKGDKLLVFEHADFPDVGLQVPAGTINQGETPIQAAFRETLEETGLKNIEYRSYLGEELYDAGEIGKEELHHRHFSIWSAQMRKNPGHIWKQILPMVHSTTLFSVFIGRLFTKFQSCPVNWGACCKKLQDNGICCYFGKDSR